MLATTLALCTMSCSDVPVAHEDDYRICHLIGCSSGVYWHGDIPLFGLPQDPLLFLEDISVEQQHAKLQSQKEKYTTFGVLRWEQGDLILGANHVD